MLQSDCYGRFARKHRRRLSSTLRGTADTTPMRPFLAFDRLMQAMGWDGVLVTYSI